MNMKVSILFLSSLLILVKNNIYSIDLFLNILRENGGLEVLTDVKIRFGSDVEV